MSANTEIDPEVRHLADLVSNAVPKDANYILVWDGGPPFLSSAVCWPDEQGYDEELTQSPLSEWALENWAMFESAVRRILELIPCPRDPQGRSALNEEIRRLYGLTFHDVGELVIFG